MTEVAIHLCELVLAVCGLSYLWDGLRATSKRRGHQSAGPPAALAGVTEGSRAASPQSAGAPEHLFVSRARRATS